jgi:hypothetical protein
MHNSGIYPLFALVDKEIVVVKIFFKPKATDKRLITSCLYSPLNYTCQPIRKWINNDQLVQRDWLQQA